MPQSNRRIAEFISPRGNDRNGLRVDWDELRRDRVLYINDTINAVSRASEAFVSMDDAEGQNVCSSLLTELLAELDQSIFTEPRDGE